MKSYKQFLVEAEHLTSQHNAVLKKHNFRYRGSITPSHSSFANGSQIKVYSHPANGEIHVNNFGEWAHIPPGTTHADDGFGGTTTDSLDAHLSRIA